MLLPLILLVTVVMLLPLLLSVILVTIISHLLSFLSCLITGQANTRHSLVINMMMSKTAGYEFSFLISVPSSGG